jgi:hypothetical protein
VIRLSTLKTLALSALAAISLSACVTATPYQPMATGTAQSGGYSETKVEQDRWRITFTGNSLTSRDVVENYLLHRAAELTLAQGKDWFMTAERGLAKSVEKIILPDPMMRSHMWRPTLLVSRGVVIGYAYPFMDDMAWRMRSEEQTLERYEAYSEIVLGTGPKPVNDPKAFDAKQVIENLGPKVIRPEPKP